ncbi:MAG: hypothetical protein J5829_02230 [Lachnospiraceae bacterium]|nr:hypothetical protein [Lachnospiraceae bacterium]
MKLYLMREWSPFGMGSDSDEYVATEENLRRIIEEEVRKYRSGDRFYSRMYTGTVKDEVFCDSEDINEVVEDVIKKRSSSSTTYSESRDLILLPDDLPVTVKREHYDDTIFRVFNQFGFERDVIAGEADFTRYIISLKEYDGDHNDGRLGLEGGLYHEFASYKMKRVLLCEFSDTDSYLDAARKKIERLEAKRNGQKHVHEGQYIDELLPEIATDDWIERHIESARKTIDKFTEFFNEPAPRDTYFEHMYDGHYDRERYPYLYDSYDQEKEKGLDHVRGLCYNYILCRPGFGCTYTGRGDKEECEEMTYGELFRKGDDFECLPAIHSNSAENIEDLKYMNAIRALRNVFGYD